MKMAIVVTKLREFEQADFRRLKNAPRSKKIFGNRNTYNLQSCVDYVLNYIGIGRISERYC